jgi:regulator of replication initiation timing
MSNLLHQRLVKIRESVESISLENKQLRGNNENLTQQIAELQKTIELQKNALYELK